MDCRQYLNCWRGRGSVQSCSPGTAFNPRTMECDHPSKVKCHRFEGFSSRLQEEPQSNRNQRQYVQRQETAPIRCENGASGLFAHPLDCRKFLNCDHGRTFIQDCGPGTVFNDVFKVCDWPHKVDCGSRDPNGYAVAGAGVAVAENTSEDPYYGEGTMDVRITTQSRGHSAPPFPQSNIRNQQQNPPLNPQQNPQLNPQHGVYQYPQQNVYNQQQYPQQYPHQPSNDGINSLNNSFSPANSDAFPSNSFNSPNTIDLLGAGAKQTPVQQQHPSPKTQFIEVPDQHLRPPLASADQSGGSNNRTSRVDGLLDEIFQGSANRTEISANGNNQDSDLSRNQVDTNFLDANGAIATVPNRDDAFLTQNKPQSANGQQFPELNYMSSRVADEFRRYYANAQPKVPPKLPPPPPTTERQPTESSATRVFSIYPSGFERIGATCEATGAGLMEHPYDCSRFVSCENGRVRVQSCDGGFLFNSILKICDYPQNVNCTTSARPFDTVSALGGDQIQVPLSKMPDDSVNEIQNNENGQKPFGIEPTTSSQFDLLQSTAASAATQSNHNTYFIPDMSVLPLQTGRYPQNTYPDSSKPPTYAGSGRPSRGGDIQDIDLDPRMLISENSRELIGQNARDGKVIEFSHDEQTTPTTPVQLAPWPTTERNKNVMKIPRGKEHSIPIYHRPTQSTTVATTTTTPTKSARLHSPPSYNQIYYQPFARPLNETSEKDEADYIPISEALKYLLRPYLNKNNTKASPNSEHMTKIENRILDIVDNSTNVNRNKSSEQDDLAAAWSENVVVKSLPDLPAQTLVRSADVEIISTTTEQRHATTTMPNLIYPHNHHDSPNQPHHHYDHHAHFPPRFQHSSPEFHAPQPNPKSPSYYKPGTNDPIKITFPGPTSQSHPMHGYNHHSSLSTPPRSFHSPVPPGHYHHGHHPPHYGPNYHTNAANFNLAANNRRIDVTTPGTGSAPPPNWYSNQDKPQTGSRFGKSDDAEVSTCAGQFDCHTGTCIPFSKVRFFDILNVCFVCFGNQLFFVHLE